MKLPTQSSHQISMKQKLSYLPIFLPYNGDLPESYAVVIGGLTNTNNSQCCETNTVCVAVRTTAPGRCLTELGWSRILDCIGHELSTKSNTSVLIKEHSNK